MNWLKEYNKFVTESNRLQKLRSQALKVGELDDADDLMELADMALEEAMTILQPHLQEV